MPRHALGPPRGAVPGRNSGLGGRATGMIELGGALGWPSRERGAEGAGRKRRVARTREWVGWSRSPGALGGGKYKGGGSAVSSFCVIEATHLGLSRRRAGDTGGEEEVDVWAMRRGVSVSGSLVFVCRGVEFDDGGARAVTCPPSWIALFANARPRCAW